MSPADPTAAPTPAQATGPSGVRPKKWLMPGVCMIAASVRAEPAVAASSPPDLTDQRRAQQPAAGSS